MKKNVKRILLTFLSALCVVLFAIGCGECSAPSNHDALFKQFKDEEITLSLGGNYRLELAPIADEEVYYEVFASVVDAQGNEIDVSNGYFTVTDTGGYVIIYTAKRGEETRQREVTVVVKNEREPNVIIGDCDTTYEVGDTFTFPTVTVYDLAGEALTPSMGVYKVVGDEKIEQTLATENTYLCESAGTYIFEAKATNSFQITGVKELTFYVSGVEAGEVESFGTAGAQDDVEVNSKYTDGYAWLDKTDASMGDRQGVLKVNVRATNQQRKILTVYPKQDYADYMEKIGEDYANKKFVVTMYVAAPVGSIPEMYAHFTSYRIKDTLKSYGNLARCSFKKALR